MIRAPGGRIFGGSKLRWGSFEYASGYSSTFARYDISHHNP